MVDFDHEDSGFDTSETTSGGLPVSAPLKKAAEVATQPKEPAKEHPPKVDEADKTTTAEEKKKAAFMADPTLHPSASELRPITDAQNARNRERRLADKARKHPEVKEAVDRIIELEKENTALKAEVAGLKAELEKARKPKK